MCGKGIYDVDMLRSGAGRANPRKHGAEPRSAGRHIRARRPGIRHRGRRGISRPATTSPPRASIAGSAATGSCCPGFSARGGKRARRYAERLPFPLIGRWKMLDNLRRSLSAPAALLALLVGWLLPLRGGRDLDRLHPSDDRVAAPAAGDRRHRAAAARASRCAIICERLRDDLALGLLQSAFLITFLAHQAWMMVDAVVRTLFRAVHPPPPIAGMGHGRTDAARTSNSTTRALSLQIAASAAFAGACRRRYLYSPVMTAGRSPCRSLLCGCCRRSSRAGRACRRPLAGHLS